MKNMTRTTKIFLALAAVLLAGGVVFYAVRERADDSATTSVETEQIDGSSGEFDASPASDEEQAQADTIKEELKDNDSDEAQGNQQSGSPQSGEQSDNITPTITRADQSGNTVYIRAFAPSADRGECTLSMKKGSQTYTRTSGSEFQSSYYQCEGFDVPTSQLSTGEWTVTVTYSSQQSQGTSGTRTVSVQ